MSMDVENRLIEAADALVERQHTAHERVGCPRCHALPGVRCHRVNGITSLSSAPLKHSHLERLRADGIELR